MGSATEAQIEQYRKHDYPDWLKKCEAFLERLAEVLQQEAGPPFVTFSIRNIGTRPAKDSLVTFAARGQFSLQAPPRNDGKSRRS